MGRGLLIAGALLAVGGLAGCRTADETVVTRLASPDDRYEGVMMLCQNPADRAVQQLVVAVFTEKGRDCRSVYRYALTGVSMTHPYSGGDARATIRWEGKNLVLLSKAERQMISGTFTGNNTQGIILLEGLVSDTYDWNAKQAGSEVAAPEVAPAVSDASEEVGTALKQSGN